MNSYYILVTAENELATKMISCYCRLIAWVFFKFQSLFGTGCLSNDISTASPRFLLVMVNLESGGLQIRFPGLEFRVSLIGVLESYGK